MPHLLVSTRKGLFVLAPSDAGWRIDKSAFLGDRVSLTLADERDGCWYAALDHGHFGIKLHRSRDQGVSWQEITAPAYPEKPKSMTDEGDVDAAGREVPWNVELIWSLCAGGSDKPGELWCGTIPGGLFHSTDHGDSWTLNQPLWLHPDRKEWFGGGSELPGIHSICVDPRDPNHVLLAVSCGGVWQTYDRGRSWVLTADGMFANYMPPDRRDDPRIQDPHLMVQCRTQPDVLWSQHHNGVFRSRDSGQRWESIEVPPSSFGFATAVHPDDPNTAWFVPAISDEHRVPVDGALVVARTRDGGEQFEVLSDGLPQQHAYDLVFRHALAVDASGARVAFGSTTGNLWLSEDQGDHWSAISAHLPPIYALTFVG